MDVIIDDELIKLVNDDIIERMNRIRLRERRKRFLVVFMVKIKLEIKIIK